MFSVYILKSIQNNRYYIGCTNNVSRRIEEHNSGYGKYTKRYAPWKLVYEEIFSEQGKAYAREKEIKSYKGGNAFKKLIGVGGGVVNRN